MRLRPEVQKFAEEMERELRVNEHKGDWGDCNEEFLISEMNRNIVRLIQTIERDNGNGLFADTVIRRCANVANFAMMIADNECGKSNAP